MPKLQVAQQIFVEIRDVWAEISTLANYPDWLSEDCYVFPPMNVFRSGEYTWKFEYQNGHQYWEVTAESLSSLFQFELRDFDLPVPLAYHIHKFELAEYEDGSTYLQWFSSFELDESIGWLQKKLMHNELKNAFEAFMYLSLRRFKEMLEDRKNASDGIFQVVDESTAAIDALSDNQLALPDSV